MTISVTDILVKKVYIYTRKQKVEFSWPDLQNLMLCRTLRCKSYAVGNNTWCNFPNFSTFRYSIYNPPSIYNINGLKQLRNEKSYRIITGHININSVRNKCESLVDLASPKLNVLMVLETNIDEKFLESKCFIEGFSEPHRLDRTVNGGVNSLIHNRRHSC